MWEQSAERHEDVVGAGVSWWCAVWADAACRSVELKA